jgi:ProP effector
MISVAHKKPVLRLKLGGSSSAPPLDPAVVPKPSSPPKPAPAAVPVPETVSMRLRALAMQVTLIGRFPAAFKPQGQQRLPLKIGIHKDVFELAPDLPQHEVKKAITMYVNQRSYQHVIIEGADRVDLNGQPSGVVTEGHAIWAQIKLGHRSPPTSAE